MFFLSLIYTDGKTVLSRNKVQEAYGVELSQQGDSINIPISTSALYFVFWGYSTWANAGFIQVANDWQGKFVKLIDLSISQAWVTKPSVELNGNNIVVTQTYGDGTQVQIVKLS